MPTIAAIQPVNNLSSLDLAAELAEHGGRPFRVDIDDHGTLAELLIVGARAGLAWGASADWTDVLPGETPRAVAQRLLLTDEQIEALAIEAQRAGDEAQRAICRRALDGDDAARRECARVIDDARAQR